VRKKLHVKFFLRKITCKTVLLVFINNERCHTYCFPIVFSGALSANVRYERLEFRFNWNDHSMVI